MSTEVLMHWSHDPLISRVAVAAILIALILIASKVLQRTVTQRLHTGTSTYRVRKIIGITAYLIALLVLLGSFSDRLAGFGVALGVTGAGHRDPTHHAHGGRRVGEW